MTPAQATSKVACSICGRQVKQSVEHRARHMIEHHPVEAAMHMMRSVPKARAAGRAAGSLLAELIQDFKENLKP